MPERCGVERFYNGSMYVCVVGMSLKIVIVGICLN